MSTRTSMALPVSSARQRFLQSPCNRLGDKIGDVTAEGGDLLHSARGEKTVLRRRHQIDRFDVGGELAVELIHLQLVLEVRDRAQSLDDRLGPAIPRELDHEVGERLHAYVAEMRRRALDELDP